MSRKQYTYYVQTRGADEKWRTVCGSTGNRSYALGWLHGLTTPLPHKAARAMRSFRDEEGKLETEVIEECGASGGVRLNNER